MAALLLAEHDNKSLAPATAKALTAARAFGGDVAVEGADKGRGKQKAECDECYASRLHLVCPS